MRFHEIIRDYENESAEERLERLGQMYGPDPIEDKAKEAAVALVQAKADKLRADAVAAVRKAEADYADRAELAEKEIRLSVSRGISRKGDLTHPDD